MRILLLPIGVSISFLLAICVSVRQAAAQQDYADCQQSADVARSIAACTRVAADASQSPTDRALAYRWLGNDHVVIGALDEAIRDYSEAIRLDPRNVLGYAARAIAFARKGDRDHAAADYRQASTIDAAKIREIAAANEELKELGAAPNACGGAAFPEPVSSRRAVPLCAAEERSLKPGDAFKECEQCPEMVVVPAGSFTMGSPNSEEGRFENEGPQHIVTIAKPFAVGRFHVTVDQFAAFVADTRYDAGSQCITFEGRDVTEREGRSWRNPGFPQTGAYPAVCLSWNDAKAYVDWLWRKTGKSYRLLSEAEWEYAARARTEPGSYPRFWFGNEEKDLCRYGNVADQAAKGSAPASIDRAPCNDGYAFTSPVGSFAANGFGLYDLIGNAWQWTWDCWHDSYKDAPSDGSAWTIGNCARRVARGGSWDFSPWNARAADRDEEAASSRNYDIGFRVGRTLD